LAFRDLRQDNLTLETKQSDAYIEGIGTSAKLGEISRSHSFMSKIDRSLLEFKYLGRCNISIVFPELQCECIYRHFAHLGKIRQLKFSGGLGGEGEHQ
jgi:hypothetical protein